MHSLVSGTRFRGVSVELEQAMLPYINGIKGRFSVEPDGLKYLNWKIGELSLTISSLTYNSNNITGSSLSKEEMVKMARSVK